MVTNFAEVMQQPEWHFDPSVSCMVAGDYAQALRHCEQVARMIPVTAAVL